MATEAVKIKLFVVQGRPRGMEIPVPIPEFIIGRDPQCNLRPATLAASRLHCAILQRDDAVYVRDIGSTNGTFVNGNRIEGEVQVRNGDCLQVGPLMFRIAMEASVDIAGISGGDSAWLVDSKSSVEIEDRLRAAEGAKTPPSGIPKTKLAPKAKEETQKEEQDDTDD